MKRVELREIIEEMVLNEARPKDTKGIKKIYYDLGDKIQGLAKLGKTRRDTKIKELAEKMFKAFRDLETHLDKEYEGWD
jgi:hypothetical protein